MFLFVIVSHNLIMNTNTLIISDLHLGSSVCRDRLIIKILNQWKFNRLIILGDAFDSHLIKRLKKKHLEVIDKINEIHKRAEVIWIKGNHDEFLLDTIARVVNATIYDEYYFQLGNEKFLALHGHRFDYYLRKHPVIGGILCCIYNIIQSLEGDNPRIAAYLKQRSKIWMNANKQISDKAILYFKNKYKINEGIVICGHTHLSGEIKQENMTYINTGSWTSIPCHYVTIDNEGKYQIREFL